SVEDVAGWRQRLVGAGYDAGPIVDHAGNRHGFESRLPSGVRFRVRDLAGAGDAPFVYEKGTGAGNILHFIVSWWPQDWEADYRFLSEGLGLVTSRGRTEPGRRIAFMRAAYGGRGIVEILDRANSPYSHPGLHWRVALMVDDCRPFHQRLSEAGV